LAILKNHRKILKKPHKLQDPEFWWEMKDLGEPGRGVLDEERKEKK